MKKVEREILLKLYIDEEKPMHQISKELGIAVGTVYNYLKKYEVETRDWRSTFTMKGRTLNEQQRHAISMRNTGRHHTEAAKMKMSDSHKQSGIGHKKKRNDGYISIYFPDHPKSNASGYIMEHVLVMESIIGRWLHEDEVVHHINKIRHDNRKENLMLMTFSEHAALHMKERHAKRLRGNDLSIR